MFIAALWLAIRGGTERPRGSAKASGTGKPQAPESRDCAGRWSDGSRDRPEAIGEKEKAISELEAPVRAVGDPRPTLTRVPTT
jgi:hypothetical protein